MNLKKKKKTLMAVLNKKFGLDFEYSMVNGHLEGKNSITINGFDDDVYCQFRFYQDGLASYCFTFDKLEESGEVLRLLSEYNTNFRFFKAYLDDGYLRLDHVGYCVGDKELAEYTKGIMNEIISDKSKQYLRPLCNLTHS